MQDILSDWAVLSELKDPRKLQKVSAKHLLTAIQQVMSSPLLQEEEDPSNRKDLYFLFRWLFQELLINLNLLRNNELIKFLNY